MKDFRFLFDQHCDLYLIVIVSLPPPPHTHTYTANLFSTNKPGKFLTWLRHLYASCPCVPAVVTTLLDYCHCSNDVSPLQASSSKNILLFSLNLLFENELKGVNLTFNPLYVNDEKNCHHMKLIYLWVWGCLHSIQFHIYTCIELTTFRPLFYSKAVGQNTSHQGSLCTCKANSVNTSVVFVGTVHTLLLAM